MTQSAPPHTLLQINGRHSCAIIQYHPGFIPTWRHFGARIQHTHLLQQWPDTAIWRMPNSSMDRMDGIPLLPCFGNGVMHAPALLAHHDGRDAVQELLCHSYTQIKTDSTETLVLHLADNTQHDENSLQAQVTLTLHGDTDVLRIQTRIINTGNSVLQIDKLASGVVPVAAHLSDVASFHGLWAHEFQMQRTPLGRDGWQMQNRQGRSSHEHPPACFVLEPTTGDHAGQAIAAHLAWSGNHHFSIDPHLSGCWLLQAGEWFSPGEVRLAHGESLDVAPMYVCWSAHGLNGASQQLHQHARKAVLQWHNGSMAPRPVHLNTWEAVYWNHDETVLKELATRAAALGIERFVLDDGWFPGRPDDRSGLGDWWPDPLKYPQGLQPLIDHVLQLDMGFGLWVEPEMVNPDSALFRQHPGWALQSSGRSLQTSRYQLVLNLSLPEVSNYLFSKISDLLSQHPISYLKWDMNRDLAQAQDGEGRMMYRAHVQALYALLARLRQAHPAVEIESCASGGGRMDWGVLQHSHRFWTSDNNDAVSRVSIQGGALRLFPPEILGAHVGPAPAHSTGRAQSMDFRCAVAFFGHMGVEADVRKLDAAQASILGRWIGLYKQWRTVLHQGTFSQGKTANGVWWMVQTGQQIVVGIFTLEHTQSLHHAPVRLPLNSTSPSNNMPKYMRVRLLGRAGHERARGEATTAWLDALQSDGVVYSADELQHLGLNIPNMNPESALVFSIETCNTTQP